MTDTDIETETFLPTCQACGKTFSSLGNVRVHINKKRCPVLNEPTSEIIPIIPKISQTAQISDIYQLIDQRINESIKTQLPTSHINHTQHMQVLCLGENDDILETLALEDGIKQALEYVKNCALSQTAGDCRMLQRIYFPQGQKPAIMYSDKKKNVFVYYNENKQRMIETNPSVMARKLAKLLQRAYLKSSSRLTNTETGQPIIVTADHPYFPVIEVYDLDLWRQHIYLFNNEKYQKKILSLLNIPIERDMNHSY